MGICAALRAASNTPPQVDITTCISLIRASSKGWERTCPLLILLKRLPAILLTLARLFFGNDQRKSDADKAKAGKKKSDKGKPEKQSDREQQDRRKPKTRE